MALYEEICSYPGIQRGELCRRLGWSWGSLTTVLTGMDNHDLLLSEDGQGRFFPFQIESLDINLWGALRDVIAMA